MNKFPDAMQLQNAINEYLLKGKQLSTHETSIDEFETDELDDNSAAELRKYYGVL